MNALAGGILILVALLGIVLTLLSLPGIWLMAAAALLVELWRPDVLSWWTIGAAIGFALGAEIVETIASAAGARKAGGSKRAAVAAIIGAIAGALLGTVIIPIPLVGTLLGAVVGAGLLATVFELTKTQPFELERLVEEADAPAPSASQIRWRKYGHVMRVGRGAAVARLWALIIKLAFAAASAVLLTFGAIV